MFCSGLASPVSSASVCGSGGPGIDSQYRPICGLGPAAGFVRCDVGSRTLAVALRSSSPPVNGVKVPVGGERNK